MVISAFIAYIRTGELRGTLTRFLISGNAAETAGVNANPSSSPTCVLLVAPPVPSEISAAAHEPSKPRKVWPYFPERVVLPFPSGSFPLPFESTVSVEPHPPLAIHGSVFRLRNLR